MKSQDRRDEETVTIFTGSLLFLLVTTSGAAALAFAHQLVGLDGDALNVLVYAVLLAGIVAWGRYIYRHRRH